MPRNSLAKMQSCILKRPSIILTHCFCTYAFTCDTSRELKRILMERSRTCKTEVASRIGICQCDRTLDTAPQLSLRTVSIPLASNTGST
jgi:hypothetical protein